VHRDPDRLRRPMRRRGSSWEEIDWETAFDEAGAAIQHVRRAHGDDAVALFAGNPVAHNYGSGFYAMGFLPQLLRTRARFSSQSIDNLPRMLVSRLLYGNQSVLPIPDVDRTQHFVCIGANPIVSNGSVMTAPGIGKRLEAMQKRGGKLVVIDPRRTETAKVADEHHFVRPGTDAALLLAMLHVIFAENLDRPIANQAGISALRELAARYSPQRVSGFVGMAEEEIRRVARDFGKAERAVIYGRVGVCIQEFGVLSTWLVDALDAVTGNLDRVGGAMFTTPAVDIHGIAIKGGQRGDFGRWKSRVRGLPEFNGELPVSALAEEIDVPEESAPPRDGLPKIRALVLSCGNPVLSSPNGARLDRALASLEAMVAIDFYLNETTRHAHWILPPTAALEHEHYDIAFHAVAVRNTVKWSPPLFSPSEGAKHDWQIYLGLMQRLAGPIAGRALAAAGNALTPERMIDALIRTGPRGDRYNPFSKGLNLKRIKDSVHGIDLGPLEPDRLSALLATDDGCVDLAPKILVDDVARLDRKMDEWARADAASLSLIGRREVRTCNSWMHNSRIMVKGRERCTLMMHPNDAKTRGLVDGARVRVTSRVGSIEVPLAVTDDVMPGVVSLPHGWGHGRDGVRLSIASAHAGASINDVTDEALVDEVIGTSSVNGVPVDVCAMPSD
jgi:anaerobic selenocysteine-containing dehydrogenase